MHLSQTHQQTQEQRRTRLLGDGMIDLSSEDLKTVSKNDDRVILMGLDFPERNNALNLMCVGSCNGLLCILDEHTGLSLYNPTIKEHADVRYLWSGFLKYMHGFGYAESIDDYRIVRILSPGKTVEVYSVKDLSWKTIRSDFLFPNGYHKVGVFLNGAIHWSFENHEGSCVIAAFDLVEETFRTLRPPHNVLEGDCEYTLGVLRGCLCLAADKRMILEEEEDEPTRSYIDHQFWVMMEYGVQESWTRILMPRSFSRLKPLCYLNSSETMLLTTEDGLVFWDRKVGNLKIVKVGVFLYTGDGIMYRVADFRDNMDSWLELPCDMHLYVESLVSADYNTQSSIEGPLY